MRIASIVLLASCSLALVAADVESRRLTHYVPQDLLEKAVRTEGWTELPLNVKGGILKGDRVRIWAGGSIDRGNGDQPGQNVNGPTGVVAKSVPQIGPLALSSNQDFAYALLFKSESTAPQKCPPPGKPLEITMTKDRERLSVGFNDQRGGYHDNHIGRGRRQEFDPLWLRVEVVRTIVD